MADEPAGPSWWVISGEALLELLKRVERGADPEFLLVEEYANSSHEGAVGNDARVLAVLETLGWPDDREGSAHVEEDGHEVTPPRHYWDTATDVVRAVLDAGQAP